VFTKQTYTYKIAANCTIQADVYRPEGDAICPAILWLHGGALIFGNRETLNPDQMTTYLRAGCVVAAVDYRLAPETKLPTIIEDIQDAYRWLRESGPNLFQIDPDRIAVIGHSAGGYLTLMTGFCVKPRPRALVSFYGYGDIIGEWYSRPDPFYRQYPLVPTEEAYGNVGNAAITGTSFEGKQAENRYRFYLYCRQQGLWPREIAGHDPNKEADWFVPYCPVHNVTPEYPPTLLIHGDQDTDVPAQQSALMSDVLKRQGVEQELVALSNRGHGFDHAGDSDPVVVEVFDKVIKFLEKQMMR
jgi:acetyl esterase/lipase